MLKKIIYGLLVIIAVVTAVFIFENIRFNNYISNAKNGKSGEINVEINRDAPVKSQAGIVIDAPVDKVWQILTKINRWSEWQPDVTEAVLKGELKEGTDFDWKAGGLSFSSQIHTNKPKTTFGWTGKTFGASAIHNWYFKEEEGKTLVKVEESLQGVFPMLFQGYFQENLDKGVLKNLKELKIACEK